MGTLAYSPAPRNAVTEALIKVLSKADIEVEDWAQEYIVQQQCDIPAWPETPAAEDEARPPYAALGQSTGSLTLSQLKLI